jgi:hypothetical protein
MKLKIGPGVNEITLLDRNGEILVGKDETGEWVNRIHISDAVVRLNPQRYPTLDLTVELFGYETELDVKEEQVTALLHRIGVTKIEGRKENADLHTDERSD